MRIRSAALFLAAFVSCAVPADAAKLCAWMVESDAADHERDLKIYLSSDTEMDFLYQMGGQGMISDGANTSFSATKASYMLHAGQTDTVWSSGGTLIPPGKIDVNMEIHQMPADIFSDKPSPLWVNFIFQRNVPANEKKAPAIFAKKQCATVPGH